MTRRSKPAKPRPDFPLFPHPNGSWAKKINGKPRYFGPWSDPEGALREFQRQYPELARVSKPAPANGNGKAHLNGNGKRKANGRPKAMGKPKVPRNCPLTPHANGQWAIYANGQYYYFGPWNDLDSALKLYEQQIGDIRTGREVTRGNGEGLTMFVAANIFLTGKENKIATGEVSREHYKKVKRVIKRVVNTFGESRTVEGLTPTDFVELRQVLAKKEPRTGDQNPKEEMVSLVTLKGHMVTVREFFNYLVEDEKIENPVRFGKSFELPSQHTIDRERATKAAKQFTRDEIGNILEVLDVPRPMMKAMVLLGLNCGFGNSDCSQLKIDHLDFKGKWVNLPRSKTGEGRKCPLWTETIEALKAAMENRYEPNPGNEEYVFLTQQGNPWENSCERSSAIVKAFREVLKSLNLYKKGRGFYSLRHTFYQVSRGYGDEHASKAIMGHKRLDVGSRYYNPIIHPQRLRNVSNHVREWLFEDGPEVRGNF
jgi:integrase